jgi:16S rRNA (cytosine1402-N4)-methyltransferase
MQQSNHTSVMLAEAIDALAIAPGKWYVDATFGGGGHTRSMLAAGAHVIAFDFDQAAIAAGQEHLATEIEQGTLILIRENFNKLQTTIASLQESDAVSEIQGILFDFGTSTDQLTSSERGFSFAGTGELDMRMDDRLGVTAKDILAVIPEKQLAELFEEFGGEEDAKRIAKAIKTARRPVTTAAELTDVILKAKGQQRGKLHPATKVFQALRIAVNSELENIAEALPQALTSVASKGKIVTIAFHDGEDRLAKHLFAIWESEEKGTVATKRPLAPSVEEVQSNPRSRSAKLRSFIKS